MAAKEQIRSFLRNSWVVSGTWVLSLLYFYFPAYRADAGAGKVSTPGQFAVLALASTIYLNEKKYSPALTGIITGLLLANINENPFAVGGALIIQIFLFSIYREDAPKVEAKPNPSKA